MQNMTSTYTISGLQHPEFSSQSRSDGMRTVANTVHQAGQYLRGLGAAVIAAVATLAGGAAGVGLALDASETEAAGLQLGSRAAH